MPLAQNIEWIHNAREATHPTDLTKSAEELLEQLLAEGKTLREATSITDNKLSLSPGDSLSLVRHFLAIRRWKTDMTCKIEVSNPLSITRHGIAQ